MTMAFNLRNRSVLKELGFTPAAHAGVPVWKGPTDESHPTQDRADALTMSEHSDTSMSEIGFATLGD
jgi:ornithine carbamoyltransferase